MTKKNIYNRTHRHRAKNKLKNPKAVRAHKRISGRTGGIWAKRNHSTKRFGMILIIPNVPTWWWQHL